jgi:hypothetical protein
MLNEVELSGNALKYIKDELAQGDVIAHYLLQFIKFEQGVIRTFLPNDVIDAENLDFKSCVAEDTQAMYGATHTKTADFITTYLSQHKNGIAVFETLASPDSPFLKKRNSQFFSHQQRVYLYLVNENANVKEADKIIAGARGYPCIGILSSLPDSETIRNQQVVNGDFLTKLSVETECIIIGAFDEDGFLFWSKSHK